MISTLGGKIFYDTALHKHEKASEAYIDVKMIYPSGKTFEGWIPIQYRRTGLDLTDEEIPEYLESIYPYLDPDKAQDWFDEAEKFWRTEKPNASETKAVFDAIKSGKWTCINCTIKNPNWARRFQDIKEFGFTFATKTPVTCPVCHHKSTYVMAIHIPRYTDSSGNGYETWSPALRKRIIKVLDSYDAYEAKTSTSLLPDHKFSEIRWDQDTKAENPDSMSDQEIKAKFQLLSNQRNQQKREVCRKCFQTGQRQRIYGINYFYEGTEKWDDSIPRTGKGAEKGCIGCPWYDIEAWRKHLQKMIEDYVLDLNEEEAKKKK